MEDNFLRGHPIVLVGNEWLYKDTKTPTANHERDCGHCGNSDSDEGHDGCLGTLPGLMNACCGHGVECEAYIQYESGDCVRGRDATEIINQLRGT